MSTAFQFPHRRRNPLTGRNVLVSPHRGERPWRGAIEPDVSSDAPSHDARCHLCPGNLRANGAVNPVYSAAYVFDNDFPALLPDPHPVNGDDALFVAEAASGAARVLCYSPDHSLTLAELPLAEVRGVIDAWCDESARLGARYADVQVFENKGAIMGCSSPHPHGQIWATRHLSDELATEDAAQRDWSIAHGRPLLEAVAEREAGGPRVVIENDDWLAIVPFWASWPFETLLLPRFAVTRLPDLAEARRDTLADALSRLTIRYDNLFSTSFPYSMGWHGAPFGADEHGWRLHAHFYPPLLRSATVRKFMVGYEMLAEAQRDLTPEAAAEHLRALPDTHYRAR